MTELELAYITHLIDSAVATISVLISMVFAYLIATEIIHENEDGSTWKTAGYLMRLGVIAAYVGFQIGRADWLWEALR